MKASNFELLDGYFEARQIKPAQPDHAEDRARRLHRLRHRLEGLAATVFVEFEDYLNARLGERVECYVDRHDGFDTDTPPCIGFRWGIQGGPLNSLVFAGSVETGQIHATWQCRRNGLRFHGDHTVDPSWAPQFVHAMLQELVLQFAPV
ncbi:MULTISPECIES: hypothetical protein [unclassified Variovorax]|jgi:hypothetical protein|uniref:hypothetical protein n=1 Tax=unclassified Variovorax TaxID=663243 RepID=UPI0008B721ED|nr:MULTISPECIES: hypothetical protein [unclassified Variovorax]SEK16470.1 hypothetical protein SAMN05518853_12632 [Variovorax sp. OK202]SFE48826.1 hypothetical protein SAMN05444746_12632 [Variovorax sp. OK212]